jgi:hypothetical protein
LAPKLAGECETRADRDVRVQELHAALNEIFESPSRDVWASRTKIYRVNPVQVIGNPDPERICASIGERQNLNMSRRA